MIANPPLCPPPRRQRPFIVLSLGAALFGLIWLAFILGALLKNGVAALSPTLFTEATPPPGSKAGLPTPSSAA